MDANANTNKVVNIPAGFPVDVTCSLSNPQGRQLVRGHVIKLSPVQLGPNVVSSLVCRSGDSASLCRLHSNIDSVAMLFGRGSYLVMIV